MCDTEQTGLLISLEDEPPLDESDFRFVGRVQTLIQEDTLMNKDQVKGRVDEVKGKAKEVVGKLIDDKDLEVEGTVEKNAGKLQAGFGDLVEDVKDATN
jgi:uncharacterized protein YjbJ (UPF0337 family)